MIRTRPSWLRARTAFSGHHSWLVPSIHFRQLKAACNCSSMGSDSLTSPCVTKHFLGRHSMHVFSLWQGFQDRPKGGYHQNPTWWADESYWGYIQEYGWELLYMPAILIFFKAFSFFFFWDNLLFLILSFFFSRPQESSFQSAEKQLLVFDGTLSLCGHQHAHTLNMYCIH